jgi:integrase
MISQPVSLPVSPVVPFVGFDRRRAAAPSGLSSIATPAAAGNLRRSTLSASSTLREFFDGWFRPIVLAGDTNAKPATVVEYLSSVAWWETLTGNPPLSAVDAYTLAELKTGLRAATWRRGPQSPARALAPHTIAKHLKQLRAILLRTGPTVDRSLPSAGLLDAAPYMRVATPKRQTPRPALALDECRAIVAAALRLAHPVERWRWVARLSVLFYTGLRIGSTNGLSPANVVDRDGRKWLVVEGAEVKTGNAVAVPLHGEALDALQTLATAAGSGSGRYFAPIHPRTLARQHDALQVDAGLAKPLGFHAWRRCHAEQMVALGAASGELAAQMALDHAHGSTTRQFYANSRAMLVDRLPNLIVADEHADQMRLFS